MHKLFSFIKEHRVFFEATLIGLAALFLRLINLEIWPRWYIDEGVYAQEGFNMVRGTWGPNVLGLYFRPPLMLLLSGTLETLFGTSYFMARLPSAIFGSISCVLLYFIGTRLYNRFIGISAAVILMLASVHINRILLMDNGVELFFLLTVFFYLKEREDGKQRWVYLAGISAGLAFLAKYSGISAMMFLVVQAVVDKKLRRLWRSIPAFSLVALSLPVIGLVIDWKLFLRDTIEYGSRLPRFDILLDTLIRSHYADQTSSPLYFNIWSTLGFILLFYMLARNTSSDRLCSIWAGAIFAALVVYGNAWWGFLVMIYPIYSLAIANTLHDIVYRKGNFQLLTIFTLFLTLPIFTQPKWYPVLSPGWGKILLIATFFLVFVNLFVKQPQLAKVRIFRVVHSDQSPIYSLMLVPLLAVILTSAFLDLKPVFTKNGAADQQAVVAWLNDNTKEGDAVAAAAPIVYRLQKVEGIRYEYVVLYTTQQEFLNLKLDLLPRFKRDCSLENMNYFVVDTPLRFTGTGEAPGGPGLEIANKVVKQWISVFSAGDYRVFRNPGYIADGNLLTSGVPSGAAPGSEVATSDDGGAKLTLASATDGFSVVEWVRSVKAYSLPIDITIEQTIPKLDTANIHAYNILLTTEDGNDFFIIHYFNKPDSFIEVGAMKDGKWLPLWSKPGQPPSDPTKWRVLLDSNTFTLYENGAQLCQVPSPLATTSFYLHFSHDTSDTTLKTWEIQSIKESRGEPLPSSAVAPAPTPTSASSFFTASRVPSGAAPGSEIATSDNGAIKLTLASATDGVSVTEWARSVKAYSLPIDITIEHTMPRLDTANIHAYNILLTTEDGNSFFIIHYFNKPDSFIEVGAMKDGKWLPLWSKPGQPPSDPTKWRVILDSNTFTLYENGAQLCQVPSPLATTSFYLHFSHDTSDTTLKTWEIQSIKESRGEPLPPSTVTPAPSFFTASRVPSGAAPGSEIATADTGASLTLASAVEGRSVTEWVRSTKAYSLPLDITIEQTIPKLDTAKIHAYNFLLTTEDGNDFFIIHYLNSPHAIFEIGVMKAGKWLSILKKDVQPPSGPTKWRIWLDSSTFAFYENGIQLRYVLNPFAATSFYLKFSHDTSDTTLKTWQIHSVNETIAEQRSKPR